VIKRVFVGLATVLESGLDHVQQKRLQFKRSDNNFKNNDAASIADSGRGKEMT